LPPNEVAEQIQPFVDYLSTSGTELFLREVMPRFK
jgi:hypothetical protein